MAKRELTDTEKQRYYWNSQISKHRRNYKKSRKIAERARASAMRSGERIVHYENLLKTLEPDINEQDTVTQVTNT